MTDLLLRNGAVLIGSRVVDANIAIRNGVIEAIADSATSLPAAETIDVEGLTILPGIIDAHVHFRDPGVTYKEDFGTGSGAAAIGGVTTVFDMPSTKPPVCDAATLAEKRVIAEQKSWVDFGLYGTLDSTNVGRAAELAHAGAIAFKIFMHEREAPYGITDDYLLFDAFREISATGLPVVVHAESNDLVNEGTRRIRQSGRSDPLIHLEARPSLAEAEAIQRAILLADAAGVRLHIAHLSSRAGVDLIRSAKARGLSVTAEAAPHHLLLDSRDYASLGSKMKVVPPVRELADQESLWRGLLDGTIDIVATDHAPHAEEEKLKTLLDAASGTIGVETSLPLMLTQVNKGRLSLARYSQLVSEKPAQIFGVFPQKGVIAVGSDADLIVADLKRQWTINSADLHSRWHVTPFDGWSVIGSAEYVLTRGRLVVAGRELVGRPAGRIVIPSSQPGQGARAPYHGQSV